MPLFLGLIWLGSVVAGWKLVFAWLAMPILVFTLIVLKRQERAMAVFRANGMSGGNYRKLMLRPNLLVVAWNGLVNGLLFAVGAALGSIF